MDIFYLGKQCLAAGLLLAASAYGQSTNLPALYSFDDGQVPAGTVFRGNNPGSGVTNAGGFASSGCLILTRPATGQNYGQWCITNDLASGAAVSSFLVTFKLYMGNGSGNPYIGIPNGGGNGLVFHLGPTPPSQMTGSSTSWGNGLDMTFSSYNQGATCPNGVNIEYNPVSGTFNPGAGTSIATSSFMGYFQTNGAADNFSEAVDVSLGLSNGAINLVCSNALIGNKVVYANQAIPGFVPISPGQIAFTASVGYGAREDAWIDNVSINLNCYSSTGAVTITTQPANQITRAGDPATFTVSAAGAAALAYQWRSNGVALPGATLATYTTPATVTAMNGSLYSATVSNASGGTISGNATLRVLPALGRAVVWNDEFNGATLDTSKWQPQNYLRTPQFSPPGYWVAQDAYVNGLGQLVLRTRYDPSNGHYCSGAVQGSYQRTFGYFEAKVKFPAQQGHWCAFWLFTMSQGSTNVIGGADGCEIDIMEKAWLTDHIQHALHWDGYSGPLAGSAGQQVRNLGMNDGGWHLFALDWTPTNYAFYVDGTLTYSTNAGGVSQVPEYMMLTEEIGNYGTGPDVWGVGSITNAILPDYFLVDYVRVYVVRPTLLCSGLNPDGTLTLILKGNAGYRYVLEGATNLPSSGWASVATLSNATGQVSYTDPNPLAYPFRAYRARLVQ